MAVFRHLLTAFFGGELDPLLAGRVDTEHYAYGLARCENFVPINEGPLVKRPGFEFVRDADASSMWLSAFRFSITQEYAVEWGALKARFFTNGGRIESSPGVAYEVTTPYLAAEAPRLSFQQSYDRLYIDHAAHAPGALVRSAGTVFGYAVSTLKNGPFTDENTDQSITVTASGTSGAITLTSSAAIFAAGHVGALFRLAAKDFSTMKVWEPGMVAIAIGDIVRSDGKVYQAATAGTTGSVQPTHAIGSEWDGLLRNDINAKGPYGIKWTFIAERAGQVQITGFTSSTQVSATVTKVLPPSLTSVATYRWAHALFSDARGWPSLVCHWAGRQVHIKDFDLAASVVGDYGGGTVNFEAYTSSGQTEPDLAFRRTIDAADPPLWMLADTRKLLAGTATREIAIGATNAAAAVAGDNISAEPQSFYGSEPVYPVQIGTETIFVERGGRRLRSAGYDFARDRYAAEDLTAAARHMTRSGVLQLAYQRIPYALVYGVRGDGQLIIHPNTKLEIKGFARTVLGGGAKALSGVSIVGADGKTDELWLLVSRTTPAGPRREIWRQLPWREDGEAQDQAFYVDGGFRAAAAGSQTHFTGAVHLAGQAIAVLANGGVVEGVVVANDGSFDLPATAVPAVPYTLVAGLAYTATAVTLRPEIKINGMTSQGLRQRLIKAMVRLSQTLGLRAGAFDPVDDAAGTAPRTDELVDRPGNAAMDRAIPLFTGDVSAVIDAQYDRHGQATFVSAVPLPATIAAAMLNIDMDAKDV